MDPELAELIARYKELAAIDSERPMSIDDPGWEEWYIACGLWVSRKAKDV